MPSPVWCCHRYQRAKSGRGSTVSVFPLFASICWDWVQRPVGISWTALAIPRFPAPILIAKTRPSSGRLHAPPVRWSGSRAPLLGLPDRSAPASFSSLTQSALASGAVAGFCELVQEMATAAWNCSAKTAYCDCEGVRRARCWRAGLSCSRCSSNSCGLAPADQPCWWWVVQLRWAYPCEPVWPCIQRRSRLRHLQPPTRRISTKLRSLRHETKLCSSQPQEKDRWAAHNRLCARDANYGRLLWSRYNGCRSVLS